MLRTYSRSPGRSRLTSRWYWGRRKSFPDCLSRKTCPSGAPRSRRAIRCRASFWSVLETRMYPVALTAHPPPPPAGHGLPAAQGAADEIYCTSVTNIPPFVQRIGILYLFGLAPKRKSCAGMVCHPGTDHIMWSSQQLSSTRIPIFPGLDTENSAIEQGSNRGVMRFSGSRRKQAALGAASLALASVHPRCSPRLGRFSLSCSNVSATAHCSPLRKSLLGSAALCCSLSARLTVRLLPPFPHFWLSRLACSRRAASLRLGLVCGPPCGPSLALASVHPHCSPRLGRFSFIQITPF